MNVRTAESFLARLALCVVAVYFPIETWASMPHVFLNPYYYVDLVAMLLLMWGALHSLRARPNSVPGLLCAGFAWASANGWRATCWRLEEILQGGQLRHGQAELWTIGAGTLAALVCLVISLCLVALADRSKCGGAESSVSTSRA